MSSINNIKLIDGNFNADEAKEVLLALYNHKIQFHEAKNFSSEIRFGKQDAVAKKRVPELKQSIRQIIDLIEEAEHENVDLVIESNICITFKEKPTHSESPIITKQSYSDTQVS